MKTNLIGKRFHRLLVIRSIGVKNRQRLWLCSCDCGNSKIISTAVWNTCTVKSCGCYRRDFARKQFTTHGQTGIPEYGIWKAMLRRCYNSHTKDFKDYGARGIRVCDAWRHSFQSFFKSLGRRPSKRHSLERNRVNGNYTPKNCRWATSREQANNMRSNLLFTIGNRRQTLAAWVREYGVSYTMVCHRLNRGWNIIKALTHPVRITKLSVKF